MKFVGDERCEAVLPSHPARGAWIEMTCTVVSACAVAVAPREGCVD